MMKGNALLTGTYGFLGAHPPIHLVAHRDNLTGTLRSQDCAQALKTLLPNSLTQLLNWFDPAIQPWLVNQGHQRPDDHAYAKQSLPWQLLNDQEAVSTCAGSLLRLGLLSAA